MAPSAVSLETESSLVDLKGSKESLAGEPKSVRHGAEDLSPLRAISHGPIVIGGNMIFISRPISLQNGCFLENFGGTNATYCTGSLNVPK
jgi:hypothetical protein